MSEKTGGDNQGLPSHPPGHEIVEGAVAAPVAFGLLFYALTSPPGAPQTVTITIGGSVAAAAIMLLVNGVVSVLRGKASTFLTHTTIAWICAVIAPCISISWIYFLPPRPPACFSKCVLTKAMPVNGIVLYFPFNGKIQPFTWLGTQCSLLSDSAFNHTSRVSYKVVTDPSFDPLENFLRIKVDLVWGVGPNGTDQPYAGIFCPLALPPEKEYFDLSNFQNIEVKTGFHWEKPDQPEDVHVRFVIYADNDCSFSGPANPNNGFNDYAFPYAGISSGALPPNGQFTIIPNRLDALSCPLAPGNPHIDLHSVYQIGIIIVGTPAGSNANIPHERTGYLDIAYLGFK